MAMDVLKNFAYAGVLIPPTPPNLGTSLTVYAGQSARFPPPPFSVSLWPIGLPADPTNAEIVRVTAIANDVWTIVRSQEGTQARAIESNDQIAQALTVKTLDDLKTDLRAYTDSKVAPMATKAYVDGQDAAVNANLSAWVSANFGTIAYINQQDAAVQGWVNYNFPTYEWVNQRIGQIPPVLYIPPRIIDAGSPGVTPNADAWDLIRVFNLAGGFTVYNAVGSADDGQPLIIRIRDAGASQPLAWDTTYRAGGPLALPTATVAPAKTMHLAFRWNAQYGLWMLLAMSVEP